MPREIRHRPRRGLRIALALLFVLGMVAQPVLAAAGDLQELLVQADAAAAAEVHCAHDADAPAPDQPHDEDPLHLLLHYAHCCAPAAMAFPVVAGLPLVAPPSRAMPAQPDDRHAQAAPGHPFRPPIPA